MQITNRIFYALCLGGMLMLVGGVNTGCSVVMEATRPAPVRLAQFNRGESRAAVSEKLGAPQMTTTDADGASCDLYSLHLSGYGDAAKAGIAFGEFAADVFTLGIAEVVSTPTEAITRNKKTPVWFCYKNDVLARITPKKLEGEDLASGKGAAALAPIPGAVATPAAAVAAASATNASPLTTANGPPAPPALGSTAR